MINASGNVGIGVLPAFANNKLSIAGSGVDAQSWLVRYSADANGYDIRLLKTRSTNIYAQSVVQSGDLLGALSFGGDDGSVYRLAASISAAVDGTPGTNDMPGRLVFSTTADGASSPTERMRIDSSGNVGIGTSSPTTKLTVAGAITITGAFALRGSYGAGAITTNFAAGDGALASNTTGSNNLAMGFQALQNNTTGIQNSAMGVQALLNNTTGNYNSAVGVSALYYNTTGYNNSAVGVNALQNNTTGFHNSAVGFQALQYNTTGFQNSAVGQNALYSNTTGNYNSAVGLNALYSNTTGSGVVGIGTNCASSSTTVSNEVNIYNQQVTARFQGAATGWSFVSDVRDKTDVVDLTLGLDFINLLKPRKFQWNLRHTDVDKGKEASGFIAQEVLAIVEATDTKYTGLVDTNDESQYTLTQTNLIPMLVNAIKELTARLEILEGK